MSCLRAVLPVAEFADPDKEGGASVTVMTDDLVPKMVPART